MGKYLGVVTGAVIVLIGLAGLISWMDEFFTVLKGVVPAMLILGGAIAVIAAFSEIKDKVAAERQAKQ